MDYIDMKMSFDRYNQRISIEEAECSRNWKINIYKGPETKKKEVTSNPSQKKGFFVNKTTRTSWVTSNTSNSNFNADIPQWSESSSSKEEDIVMRKCRRESNVDFTNEEVKGKSC